MASFKLAQFSSLVDDAGSGAYGTSGVPTTNVFDIIGSLIGVALSFLGVILLVLMIYAGFLWMTAQGDPKQVTKAKDILKNATIGLIITVSAYAISSEVIQQILGSVARV